MLKKLEKLPVLGIFETRTDQNASAALYKLSGYYGVFLWLHDQRSLGSWYVKGIDESLS